MSNEPTIPDSREAIRAYLAAEDLSARHSQSTGSAHLLLALFGFANRARILLLERHIDGDWVRHTLQNAKGENALCFSRLRGRARNIAYGAAATEVDCLHILLAMTRMRDSTAYRVLQSSEKISGTSMTALRNVAVSFITGNLPRRYRGLGDVSAPPAPAIADHGKRAPAAAPPPASQPSAAPGPPVSRVVLLGGGTPPLSVMAPTLHGCGLDLTEQARLGRLDAAIGREAEVGTLVDILGKRRANNPVLLGPPGVGKTAIVEGLALKIVRREPEVTPLWGCIIVALDTGALVAGTSLRGAFSERLGAIKAEVAAAGRKIIVFIDELHTVIGAGHSGEGPQDAASELKAALARGTFPCIGATTYDEFRKHIERDPALERRFTPVTVSEPTCDAALRIVEASICAYASHHRLTYSLEATEAAVFLSHRFIHERALPDKAFAVLDLAGSRARRRNAKVVERRDIAEVVGEWTAVPLERLLQADAQRLTQAEAALANQVVGHPQVIAAIARALRRGCAGLNGERPMGSFLFLGPTGVGKTEMCKAMAEFLFGRRDALVRFDMSELSERHSVARLVGAQPGYVGFEEGGQLTEALRKKPFQIVLFDEAEKAHPDVLNVLLQVLDEGRLTDSRGHTVSFANTLIILTSNLGCATGGRGIGFADATSDACRAPILAAAQQCIAPELWSRLDERLVFLPLQPEHLRKITSLQLAACATRLSQEHRVALAWDDKVVLELLASPLYDAALGARGLRQILQEKVESPIADLLLAGKLRRGDSLHVSVADSTLHLHVTAKRRCRDVSPAARA